MLFWLAVALLASVITYVVTRPLTRGASDAMQGAAADVAVYKDQLSEIDRDVARGAMTAGEAEAAKAEVARRLIRVADRSNATTPSASAGKDTQSGRGARALNPAYVAISLILPAASLGLYLMYGAPNMPGQPLATRIAAPAMNSNVSDLIAKVEAQLRAHPDDGKGWDVIGPVYASQGRFADAAEAFAKAMSILGETPARLERFADARIRAENGLVPEDARKALTRLLEVEPKRKEPRIWLTLAKEQAGDVAGAIADYKALLAEVGEDAGWRQAVAERLKNLESGSSVSPPGGPAAATSGDVPSGPAAAGVAAMAPEDRAAFINQMVGNLAERLKTNANDLQGWLKLVRAYKVLGRDGDATAALATARKSFATDDTALAALDSLAKELGLGS